MAGKLESPTDHRKENNLARSALGLLRDLMLEVIGSGMLTSGLYRSLGYPWTSSACDGRKDHLGT